MKQTIEECWDHDAEARISAVCAKERTGEMSSLWETRFKGNGGSIVVVVVIVVAVVVVVVSLQCVLMKELMKCHLYTRCTLNLIPVVIIIVVVVVVSIVVHVVVVSFVALVVVVVSQSSVLWIG